MSWKVVQSMIHPIKTDITQVLSEQIRVWSGMTLDTLSLSFFLLSEQWRPNSWKWAQSSSSWMRHDSKIWFVCVQFSLLLSLLSRKRYQVPTVLCEAAQPVHSTAHWDRCSPVFISNTSVIWGGGEDIKDGNTNTALAHGPAHSGTPLAIKYDEQSATSYSGRPNATTALAAQTPGPPLYSTVHIWCVCGQETPQNDYVVLQQETPVLTINMGKWQHGNSFEKFLKLEGMPKPGLMLSSVKTKWMLTFIVLCKNNCVNWRQAQEDKVNSLVL